MPKLLIFDAFTLLIREKNVAIYALLRCKMSQFTHFCGVKFLASKSGTWEFWTNFMSAQPLQHVYETDKIFCDLIMVEKRLQASQTNEHQRQHRVMTWQGLP